MKDAQKINAKINAQMEFAIANGNTIWLITDWHLIRYWKKTGKIEDRERAAEILSTAASTIKPGDIVIFMGDLIDSELYEEYPAVSLVRKLNTICSVFKNAKKKYFILGNNDWLEKPEAYKEFGFDEVVPCILFRTNILISHMPIKSKALYNIHGHLHIGDPEYYKFAQYWPQYGVEKTKQHINVFNNERRPIDLMKVLDDCANGVPIPNDVDPPATTDMKPKKRNSMLLKETRAYYKGLL